MKKLYRSTSNRMIAGVCAGVAEYLNIDPTVVRVIWAIASVFAFVGVAMIVFVKKVRIQHIGQILAGLGQMYVLDERFKNNIDRHGEGTAEYVSEAISIHCK